MGTMLASPQNHTVNRIFVQIQQTCGSSHANTLSRVVNNLPDRFRRQMQAKQGAGLGGSKPFATCPAIKQITTLILAIFAANGDIALVAKTVILALFIGTEMLLKFAHRLPPE
jgi:hypothetical protein